MNANNDALEALKAKFKKKLENSDKKKPAFNSDIYPFWNMNFGEEALIRILPDSDADNENSFYIEKCEHTLSINGKDRNIICIEKHFGEKCPICELSRKYYKAKDNQTGLYYYIKKRYLLKAIIIKDPLPVDEETKENAEGQVKVLRLQKKIVDKIMLETATQLDAIPWDFNEGYNFSIKKMKGDGGNADYILGSGFVRKSSVVPKALVDALEPVNLKALLPENPTLEKVQRLLNSHLTGDDTEVEDETTNDETPEHDSSEKPVQSTKEEVVVSKMENPVVEESTDSTEDEDDVIFQRILARKNAGKK